MANSNKAAEAAKFSGDDVLSPEELAEYKALKAQKDKADAREALMAALQKEYSGIQVTFKESKAYFPNNNTDAEPKYSMPAVQVSGNRFGMGIKMTLDRFEALLDTRLTDVITAVFEEARANGHDLMSHRKK